MSTQPAFGDRIARAVIRAAGSLPESVQRFLGETPRIDGDELAAEVGVGLRLLNLTAGEGFEKLPLQQGRAQIAGEAFVVASPGDRCEISEISVAGGAGPLPARLYRPLGSAGRTLGALVYFHGGGWVLGDLDSCDATARFLTDRADVAIISVDYRLAPENPFPAAVDDAIAAFDDVVARAEELGIDPKAVAIGGESAGGNLTAVLAQQTALRAHTQPDSPVPVFQLMFMPVTDLATKHRSYQLFSEGFFLSEEQMDWYKNHYLSDPEEANDPRVSPLLATDLTGLPPAFLMTAGFDVLRDEGEAYAARLREAGVPVAGRRFPGIVHGIVNATGVGRLSREALSEAAGALRLGLALAGAQSTTSA